MAFITEVKVRGRRLYKIFWQDATKGKGHSGRRKASCYHGDHLDAFAARGLSIGERTALSQGAKNAAQRALLLECYEALEREKAEEAERAGGYGRSARYDTLLVALLRERVNYYAEQAEIRKKQGGRSGKSPATYLAYRNALANFEGFLTAENLLHLKTGDLLPAHLERYKQWAALQPNVNAFVDGRKVETNEMPSQSHINFLTRHIKALLNYYLESQDRQPYFRSDSRALLAALRQQRPGKKLPITYPPFRMLAMAKFAIAHSEKLARFWLVLSLLGLRRHEALGLKWSSVDIELGFIAVDSEKTGNERLIPLNQSGRVVSPMMLELLKKWRSTSHSKYVCQPHGDKKPSFPKKAWAKLQAKFGCRAKDMRSNWTSYMCSLGRPLTDVALMAGHSPLVLQRNYLSFVKQRIEADSLEEAMGIVDAIQPVLRDQLDNALHQPRTSEPAPVQKRTA